MGGRGPGWVKWLGEVGRAVASDPLLLAPVALVMAMALLAGALLWSV